jgi:hypothetical protein
MYKRRDRAPDTTTVIGRDFAGAMSANPENPSFIAAPNQTSVLTAE